jgi:hypothetical protein
MPELIDDDTGTKVAAGYVDAWAEAIISEATRAIAGSDSLLAAVASRRLAPDVHLEAVVAAYRAAKAPASRIGSPTTTT